MSNLIANLSISSNNLLSTPVNISTNKSTTVQNYGKIGSIKIQPGEKSYLTEFSCGPKGAYVYVKSPSTNPANVSIKLYKENNSIVSLGYYGDPIENEENFITLLPGDFAWLPISSSCRSIYASTTNNGESTLEFMYADRGGNWGESVLNIIDDTSEYFYFINDVQTGEPGQIYPLGISYNAYDLYQISFVQDSGYVIEFNRHAIKGGNSSRKIFFVSADGVLIPNDIPEIHQIQDLNYNYIGVISEGSRYWTAKNNSNSNYIFGHYTNNPIGYAKSFILVYTENYRIDPIPGNPVTKSKLAYFDGKEIHYHDLPNVWDNPFQFYITTAWDSSTQDGTVCLYFGGNSGDSRFPNNEFYLLVNKTEHIILDYYNGDFWEPYLSINSNVICLINQSNFDGQILEMKIIDTKGNVLQNINLSSISSHDLDVHFYGKGNIQLMLYSTDSGLVYMINYNESLNRLIGGDLSWSDDSNTQWSLAYNPNYPLVDFEAPYSNYEGGSIAIMFYNIIDENDDRVANVRVDYCKIYYIIPGYDKQVYDIFSDFSSNLWVNIRGVGSWDGNIALKESIIIPFSIEIDGIEEMWNLSLKGNEINSSRIPQFDYYEGYVTADFISDFSFRAISDTQFYYWFWTRDNYDNYIVMDTNLSEISQFGIHNQYLWNQRSRNGCLLVRTPYWNTNVSDTNEHSWLYTESTGDFTNPQRYYAQRRNSNYYRPSGLNDGRILLISPYNYNDNQSHTYIGRILSKNGISNEFEFPIDRQGWNYYYPAQLGKNCICYYYQNELGKYVFNLYDLNFNLLNSYNSEKSGLDMYGINNDYGAYTNGYGDRFLFRLNEGGFYYILMITPTSSSITEIKNNGDGMSICYNDIMWNYIQNN
jgi:hypothetical protein